MAVFTAIDRAQLQAFLTQYDVGALQSFTGISAGTENSNFFVTTSQNQWVLTLFEKHSAEILPFYLDLGDFLHAKGCGVPQPVHQRNGSALSHLAGKPAVLFERLQGSPQPPTLDSCRQIGACLAQIHQAVQTFTQTKAHERGLAWIESTLQQDPQPFAHLSAGQQQQVQQDLAMLKALDSMALPRGVIHADLFHDNALFAQGQLTGVIDWYFAGEDWLIFDIAVVLNDWCFTLQQFQPDWLQSCLQAYQSVRPLTADERQALPGVMRMAALRFWLSRHRALMATPEHSSLHDPLPMWQRYQWLCAHQTQLLRCIDQG